MGVLNITLLLQHYSPGPQDSTINPNMNPQSLRSKNGKLYSYHITFHIDGEASIGVQKFSKSEIGVGTL